MKFKPAAKSEQKILVSIVKEITTKFHQMIFLGIKFKTLSYSKKILTIPRILLQIIVTAQDICRTSDKKDGIAYMKQHSCTNQQEVNFERKKVQRDTPFKNK